MHYPKHLLQWCKHIKCYLQSLTCVSESTMPVCNDSPPPPSTKRCGRTNSLVVWLTAGLKKKKSSSALEMLCCAWYKVDWSNECRSDEWIRITMPPFNDSFNDPYCTVGAQGDCILNACGYRGAVEHLGRQQGDISEIENSQMQECLWLSVQDVPCVQKIRMPSWNTDFLLLMHTCVGSPTATSATGILCSGPGWHDYLFNYHTCLLSISPPFLLLLTHIISLWRIFSQLECG